MSTLGSQRAKAIAFGLFALVLSGGVLLSSIGDMTTLMRDFREYRPVIVSERYAASGILLGIFGVSLAAVFIFSPSTQRSPPGRRKAQTRAERLAKPYLLFVLCCILAALFAPTLQQVVVTSMATARGYVHCPEVTWPRHQPDRWARSGSVDACPREGASPSR